MERPSSPSELLGELLWKPNERGLTGAWLDRAEQMFAAAGDVSRARWMGLERDGYGARTEPASLAEVLGPGAHGDIVTAILRSRLRHGRVIASGVAHQWPHFFVEPVDGLREWETKVGAGGVLTISVALEVPPGASGPNALSFPRSVFTDVPNAIALEMATALRAVGVSP